MAREMRGGLLGKINSKVKVVAVGGLIGLGGLMQTGCNDINWDADLGAPLLAIGGALSMEEGYKNNDTSQIALGRGAIDIASSYAGKNTNESKIYIVNGRVDSLNNEIPTQFYERSDRRFPVVVCESANDLNGNGKLDWPDEFKKRKCIGPNHRIEIYMKIPEFENPLNVESEVWYEKEQFVLSNTAALPKEGGWVMVGRKLKEIHRLNDFPSGIYTSRIIDIDKNSVIGELSFEINPWVCTCGIRSPRR